MPKNNNNNNNGNNMANNSKEMAGMKNRMEEMEKKIKFLENKVDVLESRLLISEGVSEKLVLEVDRLDQYHRRPNIIIRNMFKPENESNNDVERKVKEVITKELGLPEMTNNIDKLHRVGREKMTNGKKSQNVIVRFKTHHARYAVWEQRKKAKHVKISPNLTKRRAQLLFDASKLIEGLDNLKFCFADMHGDLNLRVADNFNCDNGKKVFSFNSMTDLKSLLKKMGLISDE